MLYVCTEIQSQASVHVVCLNWLQLHTKLALDLQELQLICSSHADAQVCVFLPSHLAPSSVIALAKRTLCLRLWVVAR